MSTCHVLWSHRDLNIKNNSLIRYICQLLQNSGVLLVNILFINVNKCSLSHKLKTIEHILENIKYRQEAMPPFNIKTFSKLSEPSLNSKRNFSSSYIFRKESIRCPGKIVSMVSSFLPDILKVRRETFMKPFRELNLQSYINTKISYLVCQMSIQVDKKNVWLNWVIN